MDKDYVYGVFGRTLKRTGLGGHRPYDLRHTFACLHLAEGVPLTYVAAQMGHANPTTTLRWYGRWIKGQGQRWVDVLDRRATARAARAVTGVAPEAAR